MKPKAPITEFQPTEAPLDGVFDEIISPQPEPQPQPQPQPKQEPQPKVDDDHDFDANTRIDIKRQEQQTEPKPKQKQEAIREQLKKLADEKAAAEKLVAERDTRLADIQKQRDEFESKLKTLQKEADRERSLKVVGDPINHPDVQAISAPWNNAAKEFATDMEDVAGLDSEATFKQIVAGSKRLAQFASGSDEYKAELTEVRKEIASHVGESGLLQAMKLVREGAGKIVEIQAVVANIKDNLPKHEFVKQQGFYEKAREDYEAIERKLFNPTADVIQADPMNHSVVLKSIIDGSEEVKKSAEKVKAFVKFALLPPAPIPPDELDALNPQERAAKLESHYARHRRANEQIRGILAEAILARQLLPSLFKQAIDSRDLITSERQVVRPKISEEQAPRIDEEADIRKFTPVNDSLEKMKMEA